ncbi:Heterogeneous nuclear ribonucleoproteins A1 [Echinococcus granulosus]|uniref:Heterogeneous nuclear ribonucleoproteins A1 n=1 Tax=Echinococcus granulosus TaxID=6210 RepID=W6U9I9_ECHGR|nr:Heterogeneous nuclear ribonucleoproteins A1 [Echinococcus granulosus]EUB57181.1 Heterogeneous nuclear ribonucleoproteins A1 [Echinococcus granulosus]
MAKVSASAELCRVTARHHLIQEKCGLAMASTNEDLICEVCKKLIRDPYSLPCGHTFCLLPCLLSNANAKTASCIHCRGTFDVAEVRPNYNVIVRLNQLAWERQQQQNLRQDQKEDQKHGHQQDRGKEHQSEMATLTAALENTSLTYGIGWQENDYQSSCEDDIITRDAFTCKQICVGGIPARTNCKQLRDHFSRYSTVKSCFILPYKPFSFVTFESEGSVLKAISQPIQFVCSKRVKVKEYAAKKKRGASRPPSAEQSINRSRTKSSSLPPLAPPATSASVPASPPEECQRVFISGISHKTTADSLRAALSTLGPIKACGISPSRGFAMVVFERPETAELAISTRWHIIDDELVEIQAFMPNEMSKRAGHVPETGHDIGGQHGLHSSRWEQAQNAKQKDYQRLEEKCIPCSTCRAPVEARLLKFCDHCHRDICLQCRANHRDNYILMLQAKLDDLPRHLAALKSKSPVLRLEKKAKDEFIDALDKAVLRLNVAANKALSTTIAKLETTVGVGDTLIDAFKQRVRGLSGEVGKIDDVYARLEGITNLREAMAQWKSLEKLRDEVKRLGGMMDLPPLPIMQMRLSDQLTKVGLQLNEFNLISGGSGPLSPLPSAFDIVNKWCKNPSAMDSVFSSSSGDANSFRNTSDLFFDSGLFDNVSFY